MDIKHFLNNVCKEIKYEPVRKGISEELETHIQDIKQEYINDGISEKEAEEKAVNQMGNAEEIGKKLNKVHRPKLDWKLLILIVILMGFGLTVSILKESDMHNNYIGRTIFYMLIGIAISIGVYFFDYKKMKGYSNIIYLVATTIMLLPILGKGHMIGGANYVRIFGIIFMPAILTIPLYIIAFIGFITNYNKNNIMFKICIREEEISINKDFVKILVLSAISLILIMNIPSLVSAIMLAFIYIVLITVRILQEEKYIKKLIVIYVPIIALSILLIISIIATPYRFNRIISSFKPENDPNGIGYTGMLQKEILENAKLLGEADTKVISSNQYIITKDENFTFIYLIGKIGILFSGLLFITIILTSIKLILNSKNIKEQYGRFLIIGLSTLYIVQSVASILMNINLGVMTSINIPFVTYGGTYFIINILSISIILSIYRRKDIDINLGMEKRNEYVK